MGIQNDIDNMSKGKNLIENFDEKSKEIMVEWTNNKYIQIPFKFVHWVLISFYLTLIYKMFNMVLGKWLNMENKNNQILSFILTLVFSVFCILLEIDKEFQLGILY